MRSCYQDTSVCFDHVMKSRDRKSYIVSGYKYAENDRRIGKLVALDYLNLEVEAELSTDYGILETRQNESDNSYVSVCSDLILRKFQLTKNKDQLEFELVIQSDKSDELTDDQIALGMDINANLIGYTTSGGYACVNSIDTFKPIIQNWCCHPNVETWTIGIHNKGTIMATGADNCELKLWEAKHYNNSSPELIYSNQRLHQSGVTVCRFAGDHTLFTGCYDGILREFDIRNMAQTVQEKNVDGGIWRIEVEEEGSEKRLLLALCYSGCSVINRDTFETIKSSKLDEKNCVYGVCSAFKPDTHISCSFFDSKVREW